MSDRYIKRDVSLNVRMIMLWRVIKIGFRNLFRNAWLTVAAIAVMVVALTIMLVAFVLNVTARDVIAHLSQDLKTSIYVYDNAPNSDVQMLQNELKGQDYIANVEFVSKEDAQRRFMESFHNDPQLLAGLTLAGSDTLPASIEVSTTNLARMPDIEKIAKQGKYSTAVESITLGKTDARRTIDRAAGIQNFVTTSSILAAAVFTIVSILIIFNTIRMALFTRSEEIRIMKLIGATPSYIRGPFLVEASLYGVIAGLIASTAVYSAIASIGPKIAAQEEFTKTHEYFTRPSTIVMIVLGAVFAGILVGLFSSALALKRHLKLKNW